MIFAEGVIHDVIVRHVARHSDHRGWLTEVFRNDELSDGEMLSFTPAMCYVSLTLPGMARGPHEHREQTDYLVFSGPGEFQAILWDMRESSPTYGVRQMILCGDQAPMQILVPPGVVHGYTNISDAAGLVINCPDRLFAGERRAFPVDEIRHEERTDSPFVLPNILLQPG